MILEQEHMACDEKKVDLSSIQSSHYYKYSQKIIVPLHIKWLTKYEACKHLGISRATFDRRVSDGEIPKGVSKQGSKELMWRESDP